MNYHHIHLSAVRIIFILLFCLLFAGSAISKDFKYVEDFVDLGYDNTEVEGYVSAQVCKNCHPRHFEDWRISSHSYGQISPIFIEFAKIINQKTSGTIGTFCTRCHSPIGMILKEPSGTPLHLQRKISLEGVTCSVCHRIPKNHGRSRGELVIEKGPLEDTFYGPFDKIKPIPLGRDKKKTHEAMKLPFIQKAEFCGQCHDVTAPDGFRLEDLFTEYKNSPAAREGTTCQDCHMGTVQGEKSPRAIGPIAVVKGKEFKDRTLSDHSFAGPDYSVVPITQFPIRPNEWPELMNDPNFYDWIAKVRVKLKDGKKLNRLDQRKFKKFQKLIQKSEELLATATRKRHELLRNATTLAVSVPKFVEKGSAIPIEVTVFNKVSGHGFPAGFSAERQAWLEVTVKNEAGEIIYQSGDLDSNGDLRDNKSMDVLTGKADYDHDLFNLQTKFKIKTIAGTERTDHFPIPRDIDNFAFIRPSAFLSQSYNNPSSSRQQKNNLLPLQSRTAKYKTEAQGDSSYFDISVKFNFRHFAPIVLKQLEAQEFISKLEIVELDSFEARVIVEQNTKKVTHLGAYVEAREEAN
jgi:nitrate/TMAO reductase-like tetraheme cytochrome c subunit